LLGSVCNAGSDPESKEIFNLASKNILNATASYGDRILHCNKLVMLNDAPKFNMNTLVSLGATREDTLTAVAFLRFNNYFICEKKYRLELAFHLGIMASLKKELKIDSPPVEKLQSVISYPSSRELELELKHLKLSQPQRSYFESAVGDGPFDLLKILEANNLMHNQ
jgi:hypothetical protein